jgi:dienelactone hydrolase
MSRVLDDAEASLAVQLFSLADVVKAALKTVVAKKHAFAASQDELRSAEAALQKAQEALATFVKTKVVDGAV